MPEVNAQGNLVPENVGAKPEIVVSDKPVAPAVPSADKALRAIKARVYTANPQYDPSKMGSDPSKMGTKPVAEPVADPAKPEQPAAPEIKANDKATLAELAKAQNNLREAQAKMKELEAKTADSEYGTKVKKLWAGSDAEKLQVLAELSGKDATEALADLVEMFYNGDGTAPKPAAQPDAAAKPLLDKLEALAKQVEELKAAPAKVSAEQAKKGTEAFLDAQLTKLGYEISSRAENRGEAIQKAIVFAATIVQELGLDAAKLTAHEAETVAAKSLERTEAEFAKLGQRFSLSGSVKEAKPSIYDKPISRAAPRLQVTAGDGTKPAPTGRGWEEYKERVRSAWESSRE